MSDFFGFLGRRQELYREFVDEASTSSCMGEGVETGWRAPLVDEGTVRLSSKAESDRITQRSAVQIRPRQPRTPLPKCSGVRLFKEASVPRSCFQTYQRPVW